MAQEYLLEVTQVCKAFGPTVALKDVDLHVKRGQIHGLIGENGSGKSTLTSIIAGAQNLDSGAMTVKGQPWQPASMIDALEKGVGMIVQERGTIEHITVAENIFLGETGRFRRFGLIDRKAMNRAADVVLDELGEKRIRGAMPIDMLDMQDCKLIELAKVMAKKPDVMVVDETTTALSQTGRELLYQAMNALKARGGSVIFISHDLEEIMTVCDELTVLRDGRIIRTFEKAEYEENAIKASMIGRELKGDYYRADYDGSHGERVMLSCEQVSVPGELRDVSIELHEGEILGIGGLSECGMHTLGKVLFGSVRPESGKVLCGGDAIHDERQAMRHSIGYVSKNRDSESLCLNASIRDNIASASLDRIAVGGVLMLPGLERKHVQQQVSDLSIKCFDMKQNVSQLSGGNKQKVVFGKWIGAGSRILILDCPTRGVDIGVKQAMYQLIAEMKKQGCAIVMISEEMAELIGMCDSILVMKNGQVSARLPRSESLSESDIIQYMI